MVWQPQATSLSFLTQECPLFLMPIFHARFSCEKRMTRKILDKIARYFVRQWIHNSLHRFVCVLAPEKHQHVKNKTIHVLPWITSFRSLVRWFNNYHSWLRHSSKLKANHPTRGHNIVIHANPYIILYLILLFNWFTNTASETVQSIPSINNLYFCQG